MNNKKITALFQRLAEGLNGFMTYEAKCGMSPAYSEYYLYSPIVRIANIHWEIQSEVIAEQTKGRGDFKRMDFLLSRKGEKNLKVAIEVKYVSRKGYNNLDIKKDIYKLRKYKKENRITHTFILFAGLHNNSTIKKLEGLKNKYNLEYLFKEKNERYQTTYSKFGVTILIV